MFWSHLVINEAGVEMWAFRWDQSNSCLLCICSSSNLFGAEVWNNFRGQTTMSPHFQGCHIYVDKPMSTLQDCLPGAGKQFGILRIYSHKECLTFTVEQSILIYFCKTLYEHICIWIQQSNKHEVKEEQIQYFLKVSMSYENPTFLSLHFTVHFNLCGLYCWCQISQYSVKVAIYVWAVTESCTVSFSHLHCRFQSLMSHWLIRISGERA